MRLLGRAGRWRRPSTIRLRLTLVSAAILVATCAALLTLNYVLLYRSLYQNVRAPAADSFGKPASRDEETRLKVHALETQLAEAERLRRKAVLSAAVTSGIGLGGSVLLGLGISWVVSGRMLRPLRTLTATTRRISQDRLHERVALTGPADELKELADTFDEMVARLEAAFTSQRRFVADAAHELRTPLAIARTGVEVQLARRHSTDEHWQATARLVLTAMGRAERMLDGLLALARSDSGVIANEPHDLAIAAAGALSEADAEAESAELTIRTDLRQALVRGDPVLLDRLLRNLVDNAIRHNTPGGWVEVETAVDNGRAVATVRNSGADIRPAQVGRLFEPFQRLAKHRPNGAVSTGLGLAIVRSIVGAHAGTVSAEPNPGGGLTVTVALPAVPETKVRVGLPEYADPGE